MLMSSWVCSFCRTLRLLATPFLRRCARNRCRQKLARCNSKRLSRQLQRDNNNVASLRPRVPIVLYCIYIPSSRRGYVRLQLQACLRGGERPLHLF